MCRPPDSGSKSLSFFFCARPRWVTGEAIGKEVLELAKTPPAGPTALFESIHQVIDSFPELRSGDVIFVVTDSGNSKGEVPFSLLADRLAKRGIRLFVFLTSRKYFETEEEKAGAPETERLAKASGGEFVLMSPAEFAEKNRARLENLKPQLSALIDKVYRVKLDSSLVAAKPSQLKTSLAGELKHKGEVRYQHQLTSCAP